MFVFELVLTQRCFVGLFQVSLVDDEFLEDGFAQDSVAIGQNLLQALVRHHLGLRSGM